MPRLNSLSITYKMFALIGLAVFGFAGYGWLSYTAVNTVKVNGPLYATIVQNKDLVADVLPPPEYILESYLVAHQLATVTDPAEVARLTDRAKVLEHDFQTRHDYWSAALPDGPVKRGLLQDSYAPAAAFFQTLQSEFLPALRSGDREGAAQLLAGTMRRDYEAHRAAIDKVVAAANDRAEQDEKRAGLVVASRVRWLIGIGSGITVIALVIDWLIARSITGPLRALAHRFRDIASGEGDLTQRMDESRADELGQLARHFNAFVHKIEGVIGEVKSGAVQLDAGATHISAASQSLAEGASQQAASLEQISASIEEMASMTRRSAESAKQANTMAEASTRSADKGLEEMKQMASAMNEIKQSSGEIAKIIRAIDEIAFQTNLLALNAAVEAARAGEAGKGFAVVAEEVRSLAQRSAEAAKNTSAMIDASTKRADRGVDIAARVGTVLNEIAGSARKVNALLGEIASASGEQAKGIGQVNTGVGELDKVTQQNAGNAQELASGAQETASRVNSLLRQVAQFKTGGAPDGPGARPAPRQDRSPNASPGRARGARGVNPGAPAPGSIPLPETEESLTF